MKKFTTVGAALMLTTTAAYAGGIDRSGQSIGAIFEDGKYVELSYGYVMPSVTGTDPFTTGSDNIAPDYGNVGLAFKTDLDDKVSLALIIDQPFGANVSYDNAAYLIGGSGANVETTSITAVGRYKFNENVSVFFGPRYLSASGDYTAAQFGTVLYTSTYASGSGTGYVAGAAYERQDIAMRVALTYSSAIDLELDGTGAGGLGDLTATMPQSVNLEFQSGVAADTLVFGSVRWAGWKDAHITDTFLIGLPNGAPLVDWAEDTVTYTLGVGRKFSDKFSGAVSVGYEKELGGAVSNLSAKDGYTSISVGGTYTLDNGIELTGGVRYIMVGDATTETIGAVFADNSAVAVGLKVAYNF
uniref:OmpP1/FadL family transporter n=1 Tax=Yoonia sp. TaxID=2212373 RepID=UPI0040482392